MQQMSADREPIAALAKGKLAHHLSRHQSLTYRDHHIRFHIRFSRSLKKANLDLNCQ